MEQWSSNLPDSLEAGENVSSDETGQADIDNPDDEEVVELGDDKLDDKTVLTGLLLIRLLLVWSLIRERSKGVTSLSLRLFSASLIILTTSA